MSTEVIVLIITVMSLMAILLSARVLYIAKKTVDMVWSPDTIDDWANDLHASITWDKNLDGVMVTWYYMGVKHGKWFSSLRRALDAIDKNKNIDRVVNDIEL